MTRTPLVSIGLPTYNRAAKLEQALAYVLAQDYANIEIVISDNASTDGTASLCERLCRSDGRIRYIRQSTNIGPTANYRAVLANATGEMYLALADDDWLAPNYVSACLQALLDDPSLVLVCGRSRMYQDGQYLREAAVTALLSDSPTDRVVEYYRTVVENAAFHGLVRRQTLLGLPGMTSVMAGDWLWMASIAFQGKIQTISTTGISKHMGGPSASWEGIIAVLGLPKWQARYWSEAILASVWRDALTSPVYDSLGHTGRLLLGSRVSLALGWKWRLWRRWRSYVKQFALAR